MLRTLPVPTWTQSDNELLPKWLRYVEHHAEKYGGDAIEDLMRMIRDCKWRIEEYTESVNKLTKTITDNTARLHALQDTKSVSDEELAARYQELLASPHVIGTRLGSLGELTILIDPKIGDDGDREAGFFELDYRLSPNLYGSSIVRSISCSKRLFSYLRDYIDCVDYDEIEGYRLYLFRYVASEEARRGMETGNFLIFIDQLVEEISLWRYNLDEKKADREVLWSGHHVDDPVAAMRRLVQTTKPMHRERMIRDLKYDIERNMAQKNEYLASIRGFRTTLRDYKAELAQLRKAMQDKAVDIEEARQTLRFISTSPGVIAIKFDADGTPVLHLRCSFTYRGKRYDLGDYELHLKMENRRWGTVLMVRQTRKPAGGEYTQGWHVEYNGFCFGRQRAGQIYSAFVARDFCHAVNLAIGTLNALSEGDEYLVERGHFAEIPPQAVWVRKPRARARRQPRVPLKATV